MNSWFFSPQIFYIILQWNAVILCNFTARVSGELTKIHDTSPPTTNYLSFTDSNLSPPAFQPHLLPLSHLPLNTFIFVLNLNHIHSIFSKSCALIFCKISVEITNFSCEMSWFFVISPLTLVMKLLKFTAEKVPKRCIVIRG